MAAAEGSDSITGQMEDAEFAARIRAGDREALQAVVHAYMSQVLRAARGAGLSPQRAEDVTQATFATFIEVGPRFWKVPRAHFLVRHPVQEDCRGPPRTPTGSTI